MRAIYQDHCPSAGRIAERCGDDYVRTLASAVAGKLGGRVGIAPRIFLKKLVAELSRDKAILQDVASKKWGGPR